MKEIVHKYGWPTIDLVGKDGEDAAWAIAQHSDFDLAFQQEALALLREAAAHGRASPGNLAYLEDRVAVAKGEPQVYGTQMRCGPDPSPRDPDPGRARRRPAASGGGPRSAGQLPGRDDRDLRPGRELVCGRGAGCRGPPWSVLLEVSRVRAPCLRPVSGAEALDLFEPTMSPL
ncbi:DUF6624 domain-containing protein [Micromonospora rhizosphaerae]|uniref:DUF6624 domain-containing protein n=1 Tax=Micromonospora rhizosphaerae TaxID=568872 RepID=UPI003CCBD0F3